MAQVCLSLAAVYALFHCYMRYGGKPGRCALCNQPCVELDTRSNCAKCAEISRMEAL